MEIKKNKKMKNITRKDLLPARCSRCGSDFMLGQTLLFLPYENRYISFCAVCSRGLEMSLKLFTPKENSAKEWKEFWGKKI
jgi:hypothetical protein